MGGVLGFILASKVKVDGLISIATPIAIKGFLPKLAPIMDLFIKFHRIDSDSLRSESNNEWIGYDEIPLNIVSKINSLLKIMKSSLDQIDCPILLFQGRLDDQIAIDTMEDLYRNIRSKIKRKIYLENNQHPILNCPDHDIIVREVISFIKMGGSKNLGKLTLGIEDKKIDPKKINKLAKRFYIFIIIILVYLLYILIKFLFL